MYRYDAFDHRLVQERVAQFRDQTRRFLIGELSEDEFRPLRLQNGLYIQRHAPMFRISIPYGLLSTRQLRKLADISYSIYLYHVMVLHFCLFTLGFDRQGTRADFLTLLAAALAITLALAWVSYVLVERPGRRLGRRLARRYERASEQDRAAPQPTVVVR